LWNELLWLCGKYGEFTSSLVATDNIMPRSVLREVLPRIGELKVTLFYETKANLRLADLELFAQAGLRRIQPGIESLSTPILRLMRKGVTGLQNIATLKWCLATGVVPSWNYLIGFPGEEPGAYEGQRETIRSIYHLPPPQYCGPIRIDRFSPYHQNPADFGLRNLEPSPAYAFVYPELTQLELGRLAYFFTAEWNDNSGPEYINELVIELKAWKRQAASAILKAIAIGPSWIIVDKRSAGDADVYELSAIERDVLQLTDDVTGWRKVLSRLQTRYTANELQEAIQNLSARRLLLREEDSYLSLVLAPKSTERPAFEDTAGFDASSPSEFVILP
jgi:ribosomal peptide maturation radical SAM protein 1